jgi:membrane-associated phospholipid phosphatase
MIGLRPEHGGLCALVFAMWYASSPTRHFVRAVSAFIIFWVIYDSLRIVHNVDLSPVHIADLYQWEKSLFPVRDNDIVYTWNEWWQLHTNPVLDFVGGLFYLCWIPVPLLFTAWLWKHNRRNSVRYSYAFLFVNIVGFVVYYTFPAAPPWYVQEYGWNYQPQTLSNAAGLLRFDAVTGINLFSIIYTKGSNTFAAMPSLHAAYPMTGLIYVIKMRRKLLILLFLILTAGIWFSAVYLNHHYILDVLAGGVVALIGVFLFEKLVLPSRIGRFLLDFHEKKKGVSSGKPVATTQVLENVGSSCYRN